MTAYESWRYDPAPYTDHAPWYGQVAVDPEGRKWPVMSYSSGPQARVTVVEYVEQVEHVGMPARSIRVDPSRNSGPKNDKWVKPSNPTRDDPREAAPYQARVLPEPSHPHPRSGPLDGSGQGGDQPPGMNCEDGVCTFDENRDKPRDYGGQTLGYRGPTAERYERREYGVNRREKPGESKGNKVNQREKPSEANFPSSKPVRDPPNDRSKDLHDPRYTHDLSKDYADGQGRKMSYGWTPPSNQTTPVEKTSKSQRDKPSEVNYPLSRPVNNQYGRQKDPYSDRSKDLDDAKSPRDYGDNESRKVSYGWTPPSSQANPVAKETYKNQWGQPGEPKFPLNDSYERQRDPRNDRSKDLNDPKYLDDWFGKRKASFGWTSPPSQANLVEKAPNKNQWDKPGEANFPLNNSYRPQMEPHDDRSKDLNDSKHVQDWPNDYGDSVRMKPSYDWARPPDTTTNKNYWDKPSDPHNDRFKDLDDVKHLRDQPKDKGNNQRGKVTYGWTLPPSQATRLGKATNNMEEALQQLKLASYPSSPPNDINKSEADGAKEYQKQITCKDARDKYNGRSVHF